MLRYDMTFAKTLGYLARGVRKLRMDNKNPSASNSPGWWKRRGIEIAGWVLVIFGLVVLVLPGPGLLGLVAGLVLLATRYAWAERLLRPVKIKALQLAIRGVQIWPRITGSVLSGFALIAVGIVWGVRPATPRWWPIDQGWWLVGGWGTAITLMVSGAVVLALLVYSFRRFRNPTNMDFSVTDPDPQT